MLERRKIPERISKSNYLFYYWLYYLLDYLLNYFASAEADRI